MEYYGAYGQGYDPYSNDYGTVPEPKINWLNVGWQFYRTASLINFFEYTVQATTQQLFGANVTLLTGQQIAKGGFLLRPQQSAYTGVAKAFSKVISKYSVPGYNIPTDAIALNDLNFGYVRWQKPFRQILSSRNELLSAAYQFNNNRPMTSKALQKFFSEIHAGKATVSNTIAKYTDEALLKTAEKLGLTEQFKSGEQAAVDQVTKRLASKYVIASTFADIQVVYNQWQITSLYKQIAGFVRDYAQQRGEYYDQVQSMKYYRRLQGMSTIPEFNNRNNNRMTRFEESQILNQIQNQMLTRQIVNDRNLVSSNPYLQLYF